MVAGVIKNLRSFLLPYSPILDFFIHLLVLALSFVLKTLFPEDHLAFTVIQFSMKKEKTLSHLMESQIRFDCVCGEEELAVAVQDHEEALRGLDGKEE